MRSVTADSPGTTLNVRSTPSMPTTVRCLAKASTRDQSSRSWSTGSTVVRSIRSTSERISSSVFLFTPTMRSPTETGAPSCAHTT